MNKNPAFRYVLVALLTIALLLPIAICVMVAMAALLGSMGDAAGSAVLRYVALGFGILWVINLIVLVIANAVRLLPNDDDGNDSESS